MKKIYALTALLIFLCNENSAFADLDPYYSSKKNNTSTPEQPTYTQALPASYSSSDGEEAPAPAPVTSASTPTAQVPGDSSRGLSPDTPASDEIINFDPEASRQAMLNGELPGAPPADRAKTLPGGRIKMSGRYRLAAGFESDGEGVLNRAHADLQDRNFRYLFGERQANTYDPAIYSQYLLNVDFSPREKWNFYTQIVVDPWSWVGSTGDQYLRETGAGNSTLRYNLKYFGAYNSTLNEAYRASTGDLVGFPLMETHKGNTGEMTVRGFLNSNGSQSVWNIPATNIDYEFRPFRKAWLDYTQEQWHARAFILADQTQALTSDDPLGLSNHKDYWQQSPWLYQYQPLQHFSDGTITRGFYNDSLSFLATDSEGNRLVLLRGFSVEGIIEDKATYFTATVAAPYTPWDEHYFDYDNIPGAMRIKHQASERLMLGGTYAFRYGLVDDSIADKSQVFGIDFKYNLNKDVALKGEIANSYRERDLREDTAVSSNLKDFAYKGELEANFDHKNGSTEFSFSYTQMGKEFQPVLSRYTDTRDDDYWSKHLSFTEYTPELEAFRIGDGVDINRSVFRVRWKEKWFKDRFVNLFDVRNVHTAETWGYKETVLRDEITYRFTNQLTAKGMFRWQGLPKSNPYLEPFISNYYFIGFEDPWSLQYQNVAVPDGKDPSRFTYAGGLQYVFNQKWTVEGFTEISNDLPDFPRGLLNSNFRDANQRIEGILTSRITNFLYGQGPFGGVPPYEYHTLFRERLIYKPDDKITVTFHAAQNGYKFASGIDDNINHQGVSVTFDYSKKLRLFADYTHSNEIDVAHLIASNYTESNFDDHHNLYASMDYQVNLNTVFRAEYGVFGLGTNAPIVTPYSVSTFSLPTVDTEHLFRISLTGDF